MTTAKATKKTVFSAAESLAQDGYSLSHITVRKVKEITEGSLSTVSKFLSEWKQESQNKHDLNIPIPLALSQEVETIVAAIWYAAVTKSRSHFESSIADYATLQDDLTLYKDEVSKLENENQALTDELANNAKRFVSIIDDSKEVFYTHSSKVKDAIAEGEMNKTNAAFDVFHETLTSQLKMSLDDQQIILSNYINKLEIIDQEVEIATENTNTSIDLKQSEKLVEASITQADQIS